MSLESLNFQVFQSINAPADVSTAMTHLAIFIANDTLYLLLLFLIMAWFLGHYQTKALALKAVITTALALSIGYLISLGYPHPRPFIIGMGHTLISHAPTASFPSNHMLIFSSIAFSYLFAQRLKLGLSLLLMAFLVAWSRIYVGVHFPLDMLGAFCVALLTNFLMQWLWQRYQDPIMSLSLKIYQFFFGIFLQKGWLR